MKKIKAIGLLAISSVLLTGCIDAMPDLTDEQTEMISEYSARLLLKYSSNYNYRLADDRVLADALLQESLMEAETEESSETAETEANAGETGSDTQPSGDGQGQADGQASSDGQTQPETQTGVEVLLTDEADIAQLLGIDGVAIKYQSFEICGSYPQDSSGFSVTAAQGRKLLVVHFDIESATGDDAECNLFDRNLSIRVNVSDKSAKVMSTLLPDDIASYIDTIHSGEVKEVVAVAEIADMDDSDIETLTMHISSGSGSFDIQLR